MGNLGILLVGHGSSKEYNKELVTKTADLIAKNHPEYTVRIAFMWVSKPTIPESLEKFREENIDSLVVVPLFLERGIHIDEDIPKILNLPSEQKKGVFQLKSRDIPLIYADPIGPNPVLADLMIDSARKALSLI